MVTTRSFRRSRALVIGVDAYANGVPPLRNAVRDALAVGRTLGVEHGFAVDGLFDRAATVAAVLERLARLRDDLTEDDRAAVFIASHGLSLPSNDGLPAGYLLLHGAVRTDPQKFLPMRELYGALARLRCRHLMVVLDCCFAGMFRWASRRDVEQAPVVYRERYHHYVTSPAWQALVSAASDQQALDVLGDRRAGSAAAHSPFAAALLDGLAGAADLDGNGLVTATELYWYIRGRIEGGGAASSLLQTPGLFPLERHEHGEFVFQCGATLELPPAPELDESSNPYRGLDSYEAGDAAVFFGRDRAVAELLAKVPAQPLTVVVGRSGAGKSSLVKAGVVPVLASWVGWHVVPPQRPGTAPLAALRTLALAIAGPVLPTDPLEAWATAVEILASWQEHTLVVIDQLEELVVSGRESDAVAFLVALCAALTRAPRLHIIATVRSDIEPRFHDEPLAAPLSRWWRAGRVLVQPLTRAELRDVIVKPASARVVAFESDLLVDQLIDDVATLPSPLPLLSFALSELYRGFWKRRVVAPRPGDRTMRASDLAAGSVGSALTKRASEVLRELGRAAPVARNVLLRMVTTLGGELVRRRVLLSELEYPHLKQNRQRKLVLEKLHAARLITLDSQAGGDGSSHPFAEPAHDELVRGWNQMEKWLRKAGDDRAVAQAIAAAAEEWRANGKPAKQYLWNAHPRLPRARQLATRAVMLNVAEVEFVEASSARRRRVRSNATVVWSTITLLLGLVSAFALTFCSEAQHQRQVAETRLEASQVARAAEQFNAMQLELRSGTVEGALTRLLAALSISPARDPARALYLQHATAMIDAAPVSSGRLLTASRGTPDLAMASIHRGGTRVAGYDTGGQLRMWVADPGWRDLVLAQREGLRVLGPPRWSTSGAYLAAVLGTDDGKQSRERELVLWNMTGKRVVATAVPAESLVPAPGRSRIDICGDDSCAVSFVRCARRCDARGNVTVTELPGGRTTAFHSVLIDEDIDVASEARAPTMIAYGPRGIRLLDLGSSSFRLVTPQGVLAAKLSSDDRHVFAVAPVGKAVTEDVREDRRPVELLRLRLANGAIVARVALNDVVADFQHVSLSTLTLADEREWILVSGSSGRTFVLEAAGAELRQRTLLASSVEAVSTSSALVVVDRAMRPPVVHLRDASRFEPPAGTAGIRIPGRWVGWTLRADGAGVMGVDRSGHVELVAPRERSATVLGAIDPAPSRLAAILDERRTVLLDGDNRALVARAHDLDRAIVFDGVRQIADVPVAVWPRSAAPISIDPTRGRWWHRAAPVTLDRPGLTESRCELETTARSRAPQALLIERAADGSVASRHWVPANALASVGAYAIAGERMCAERGQDMWHDTERLGCESLATGLGPPPVSQLEPDRQHRLVGLTGDGRFAISSSIIAVSIVATTKTPWLAAGMRRELGIPLDQSKLIDAVFRDARSILPVFDLAGTLSSIVVELERAAVRVTSGGLALANEKLVRFAPPSRASVLAVGGDGRVAAAFVTVDDTLYGRTGSLVVLDLVSGTIIMRHAVRSEPLACKITASQVIAVFGDRTRRAWLLPSAPRRHGWLATLPAADWPWRTDDPSVELFVHVVRAEAAGGDELARTIAPHLPALLSDRAE